MDACDPGIDIQDLKTLIKQNTGEDIKLTRGQICDVYATIQDGKLPLPPLILSRDKSYLLDRKSPLTITDFEKLFSSSTKVASIRRIAKKVGLARHADKSLTKAQLISIIGRKLHSLNVHEPIRLRTVHKKKINVKPFNVNSNSNNLMSNIKRENGNNNSNRTVNYMGNRNNNSNRTNGNYKNNNTVNGNRNNGNNRNNNRGRNMFSKAKKPNFLKNNSNTRTPYREAKGAERGRVKNMFSSFFSGGFRLKSENEINAMAANKRKFYLQKPEKLYTQLRNEGYIGNESFRDWHKRFKKAAKEHVGKINRGDYKDLISQVVKFPRSRGPLASQQQSRSNNVSGSTLSPTTPASSVQGPQAPTPSPSPQPSPTPAPSVKRTLFPSGNDNIKKQSILNKMRQKAEERKIRAEERRRAREAAAEARRQAKINRQKEINNAKNENNRKQKLKKAKYNNASGLRLNLNNQSIKNLINNPNVTLNNASNKFKNYKKKNHNKLNAFLKSNNGTLKLNENSIKELHNILNEPRSLSNTVKNAKQKIEQKFRNKENANTEARKQFVAELEQFAASRSLNKSSRNVQNIIRTQRNTKRNVQNGNSNKFAGKEITTAHRMIQKLANTRDAKRIEEINKFLNENSNAKKFIQNRNGIKRRVLAEPKTSIKDIITDIKKDIKSSQNQGIKANANALRANYTGNAGWNNKTLEIIGNFESRKRTGGGLFKKGEIKYPTKQSVINAIEQLKKNKKNKNNKKAINNAEKNKQEKENSARKAANKEQREANINELKTNARYQNEKYQKIIQNYINQKTRMFSSKPIYPNKQSVKNTINKKISNNKARQAKINAKKLSGQKLKEKMAEKEIENAKAKEERLARAEELKTYIASLNENNFKAQDFRTNRVVARVIGGGITNIELAKKEVNAIVAKRKGTLNVKKQKNANVAELRNKYGNNANAKIVINKFEQGARIGLKKVTKERAITIINKKIEDRKGKAIAQQKLQENAERNSAAFDEFLKTFANNTFSEQRIKSISPIPRLIGQIKKGRYDLEKAKTRAEKAIKDRKKANINAKQAAKNAMNGGTNAWKKAQQEKKVKEAQQNANEALKKKNEQAKKAAAAEKNRKNKQEVANLASNAINAVNKRNEQAKKAAAAKQNAINKQKIANNLKAKANAIQKRRNLELQEKQRKLEEKRKANENAKREKEKINQNAKNAIKRNEEAKAKKANANKKVQNLKVLEKMLSTSTLPINAQQKFRNRLKTESLNKFKTNVITAIKTKRGLNKNAETRKEREKLKEQENQRKQLLLQAKQKEEQNKKQNYANKKQKALNKISSLTFNENKKRNLLNNVRRETINSRKPLTNFTLAAERYANQFAKNKKKAAFNAKREQERKQKEHKNQANKEQKEREAKRQEELKKQQSNKAAANAAAAANKKKQIEEERRRKRQEKNEKKKREMEQQHERLMQMKRKALAEKNAKIAKEKAEKNAKIVEEKERKRKEMEQHLKEAENEKRAQMALARKREKERTEKAAAERKAAANKAAANKKAANEKKRKLEEMRIKAQKLEAEKKAKAEKAAANRRIALEKKAKANKRQKRLNNLRNKEISGGNKVVNEATQRLKKRVDKFVPSGWAGGRRREFMNRAKRMGVMSVHTNLNARLRLKKQVNKSVRSNKKELLNQIHDPKYTISNLSAKVRKPPPPLNT